MELEIDEHVFNMFLFMTVTGNRFTLFHRISQAADTRHMSMNVNLKLNCFDKIVKCSSYI